jgi:hypothetical protein
VSTITIERPNVVQTLPEWRRICHIYEGDSEISVCRTAVRKRGEEHQEAACHARGHTICVVCCEICARKDAAKRRKSAP